MISYPFSWKAAPLLLAAAFLVSCDKEQDVLPLDGPQDVTCYIGVEAAPMSKTSLEAPGEGGSAPVLWSGGDEIGVVVSGTTTVRKATLVSGAGTGSATFSVAGAVEGESYSYAIYPYAYAGSNGSSSPTISGDVFSVTLPKRQPFLVEEGAFKDGIFASKINTMAGTFDSEGHVTLHSVCGIFEVPLSGTDSKSLWSVALSSDTSKLSGAATVDMSGGTPVLTMGTGTTSFHFVYKQSTVDLYNTAFTLPASGTRSVYFVVPAQTYQDLRIATCCGTYSTAVRASRSHTATPCVIKRFPAYDCTRENADLVDDAQDLCVGLDGTTPEYANCYLVPVSSDEKHYRISGCYSDGTTVLKYPDGTKYLQMGTLSHVFPYWESEDGLITRVYRNGNDIYFGVKSGARGNALLLACNNSWTKSDLTWHIWVSDAQPQVLDGGTTWLNCNLGAMRAPASLAELQALDAGGLKETMGLFYQWGSPIPKVGADGKAFDGSATSQVYSSVGYVLHPCYGGQYDERWTASATLTNGPITYPNYFYSSAGSYSTHLNIRNTGNNALWQSTSKTMFDPCPPGYRIPSRTEIGTAFTNSISGASSKTYQFHYLSKGTAPYAYLGGCYLTGTGANNGFIFFPWPGVRANRGVEANQNETTWIGRLINTWTTQYHRFYVWYAEPSYTAESIAALSKAIRYGNGTGGKDITAANSASYGALTYPVMLHETTNTSTSGNPYLDGYKLFLSAGATVRCVQK